MAEQIHTADIPSFETEPAEYKELQLDVGDWNIYPDSTNFALIARLTAGSDAKIVQNGRGLTVKITTPSTSVFLQATCPKDTTCKATYSNTFFFSSGGVGGSGGGGTPPTGNYTFSAPLFETAGNVSIALSQSLQVTQNRLDLNLNANTDFKNALLGIDDAKQIATYTTVGRVMPMQGHFQLNTATGELGLDLSPTGALSQNFVSTTALQALDQRVATAEGGITANAQSIQAVQNSFNTLDGQAVKITDTNQDIDGLKNFVKELKALSLQLKSNAVNAGAVDIHTDNGYFSISKDNQGALQLLAGLGFIDGTNTLRIRNLAGGFITFNTLARYERTFTPTDDKELVPLATLNQVKAELLALIRSLEGGLTFIGEISSTKDQVTTQPDLLTQFVQQTESRAPRKGDLIRTSDSYGFIFNGANWANFGQISVIVATTTQAGLVMLGTQDGELEDIGNGRVKVIGWDTITQALTNLDRRISTNAQNIQQIQTLLRDYARLAGDNTFSGSNTFSALINGRNLQVAHNIGTTTGATSNLGAIDISGSNRFLSFSNMINQRLNRIAYIGFDSSTGGQLRIFNQYPKAGGGFESIVVNVPIEMPSNYTPTQILEVANKGYVDNSVKEKANSSEVVNLTDDQEVNGVKTFVASPIVPEATNDNQATNLGNVTKAINTALTSYKKTEVIQVGGSLPTVTNTDTIYFIEV